MPDHDQREFLDPELRGLLAHVPLPAETAADDRVAQIAAVRAVYEAEAAKVQLPRASLAAVRDLPHPAPGLVPLRIYRPREGLLPAMLFLHAGGWVAGGLESCDGLCAQLATAADTVVVSVQYRLAPEHPYPAALHDAADALRWLADPAGAAELNIDPRRLAVGGESAGATLAAGLALLAREGQAPRLAAQLLVYPMLDRPAGDEPDPPARLTAREANWYWDCYLPPGQDADELAAPLRAVNVRGVAAAVLVSAEFCSLRDQARRYAERLRAVGVDTDYRCERGMVHGFLHMTRLAHSRGVAAALGAAVGRLLQPAQLKPHCDTRPAGNGIAPK